jgi:microcystin-dependent protein
MAQPFIGQVIRVGFNFAPVGYMLCWGQLVSIAQNDALFALLGTTFGGDGVTTFGLPDLRGRVPISQGQSGNTSNYAMGQLGGLETVTLTTPQMPAHSHLVAVLAQTASSNVPSSQSLLANEGPQGITQVYTYGPYDSANETPLNPLSVGPSLGGFAHENRQPYLTINYCIALQGLFPSPN